MSKAMADLVLYSDQLVEIREDSILFRNFFYPFGDKRISTNHVESITVLKPTLLSGKYRTYGTGDFRTWFPPDNRSKRDRIFVLKRKDKWWRIGFTVEDSEKVLALLKRKFTVMDQSGA